MISTTENRTAFDPSSLKVGDEVSVTWMSLDGPCEVASHVTAIEDGGFIEVEGQELPFWPTDGREVGLIIGGQVRPSPNGTRLCELTDEGRRQRLLWDVQGRMETLEERLHDLTLEDLKRVDATISGLLAEYPEHVTIDVPCVREDTGNKRIEGNK